jgi:tetratricopeptide (TPR) repeat protein
MSPRAPATSLVVLGVGLIAFTLLQCVPLPVSVLHVIAPENADVWSRALSPLKEAGPAWAPISLDPSATKVQALRGMAYLLVFLGALRIASRQHGTAFLERILIGSAALFAVATLIHPALGLEQVFGVYRPVNVTAFEPRHLSPLLNTNHQAAYVNIGACAAVGVALSPRPAMPRSIALAAAAFFVATALWTSSRGGVIGLCVGIASAVVLTRVLRGKVAQSSYATLVVGGPALLGVGAAVLSSGPIRAKLTSGDMSKLELAKSALGLAQRFAGLGIGRGAFESVFPSVRQGTDHWVYTHPENIVAQWLSEWGFVVGGIGLIVLISALRPQVLAVRAHPPIGAWAALACLAVHNLVDFNSEVPGVMIAASVCAALVVGGSASSGDSRQFKWAAHPPRLAFGASAAALVLVLVAASSIGEDLASDQRQMQQRVLDAALARADFISAIRGAMLRHPADPYFPFLGALRTTLHRDDNIVPWASRTLERSPVYGRMHLLLARWLFARVPSQARLEYRLAFEQELWVRAAVLAECPRLVRSFDDAMELVPPGKDGLPVLEALATALQERLPATRVRLDAEILSRDPAAIEPVQRAVRDAVADARPADPAPWCATSLNACLDAALGRADALRHVRPSACDGHAFYAELRIAKGEVDEALSELDRAADAVDDRARCLRRAIELASAARRPAKVDQALEKLTLADCNTAADCVSNLEFAAAVEEGRGNTRRALLLYNKALEADPGRDDLLERVALSASRLGLHAEARDAYAKLAERHPEDPRWREGEAQQRNATRRDAFRIGP